MASISIQFHAVPEELVAYVDGFVEEFGLFVVGIRFFPFEMLELTQMDLPNVILSDATVKELAFSIGIPPISATNALGFSQSNPNCSYMDIGRISEVGLEQSCFSATAVDRSVLDVWKKLARRLRALTKTGVCAVNLNTGESVSIKSFRYSKGAIEAEASGISILSPAKVPNIRLAP